MPQLTTGPSAVASCPTARARLQHGRLALAAADRPEEAPSKSPMRKGPTTPARRRAGRRRSRVRRYDGKRLRAVAARFRSGGEQPLTANGGVNVEPRLSPDGKRLVFVSTGGTGHFDLKIADLAPAGLANERYRVAPRESAIDRYTIRRTTTPSTRPGRRTASASRSSASRGRLGDGQSALWRMADGASRLRELRTRRRTGRHGPRSARREARALLLLPRPAVASALAHDRRRRRRSR